MVSSIINGVKINVAEGTSILDAARAVQIKIPTLCKHKDLLPSAACGVCVVRIKGSRKLLRACCTDVEEGMEITTHDPEIVEIRKTVVEMILSNHPNECLSCGRNQNCELQNLMADFGIREEPFSKIVRDLPCDRSTGAIILEPSKCIKCGRCIEVCQEMQDVWALSFLERGINTRMAPAGDITLAESPCVKCGQCSAHCPTGAIFEEDNTAQVWAEVRDPSKVCIAQIAPAVRVAIGEGFGFPPGTNLSGKVYAALRRLGFDVVFDTNWGADLTIIEEASEFVQRFTKQSAPLPLITTCCPSWVDYLEKYYPELIPHFSSAKSPHEMLGTLAKTYYPEKAGIDPASIAMVSIMPCTAKKYEITRTEEMFSSGYQDVDAVLTTRELIRMIRQAGIDFAALPDEAPDHLMGDYSGAGTIFGATGGVMEAALRTAAYYVTGEPLGKVEFEGVRGLDGVKETQVTIAGNEIRIAVAHGLLNVEFVMNRIKHALENGKELPYHFVEVMACPGGCVGGGGQPYGITDELRLQRAQGLYNEDASMRIRCSHDNPYVQKLYKEFLGEPLGKKAHHLLHTEYHPRPVYVR